MSWEIFCEVLELARDYDSTVVLGGGEPTLHPRFIDILARTVLFSALNEDKPLVITNGTCDEDMWILLRAAHEGELITLGVSQDPWHDQSMVKSWVECDAEKLHLWWGDVYEWVINYCGLGKERRLHKDRAIVLQGRARTRTAQEALEEDAWNFGYSGVRLEKTDSLEPRAAPDGHIWVDTPRKVDCGQISDTALGKAHEAIRTYEDRECEGWAKRLRESRQTKRTKQLKEVA